VGLFALSDFHVKIGHFASIFGKKSVSIRATTRKHIKVEQKYIRRSKRTLGWSKYSKYNKVNNCSENFRWARLLLPSSPPLVAGLLVSISIHHGKEKKK